MGAAAFKQLEEATCIVLFDGVCNFCNGSVKFIIRHDAKKTFLFASLQSSAAQKILHDLGEEFNTIETIVCIHNHTLYTRSRAVLEIVRRMNGLWPLCYAGIIIPRVMRDFLYRWIARNRYRWFGKKEVCMVPGPEL
jgi:predicted DCC family thiol-disulfide oxidoreductase YuxK